MNLAKYFIALALVALLTACGGGGGNPGTNSAGSAGVAALPLFTSAPTSLSLTSGSTSPSYSLSGGVAPYTVTSDKPSLMSVPLSGSEFSVSIAAGASGSGSITITDAKGAKLSVTVTVPAPAALFTTAPASLSLVSGATSPTYSISAGVAPYTAGSDTPSLISVSLSGSTFSITTLAGKNGSGVVSISDSAGTKLSVTVTVPAPAAMFTTAPVSLSLVSGATSPTYSISGGVAPYTAGSDTPSLMSASLSGSTFTVSALAGKNGSGVVTVSDSAGAKVSVTVTVPAPATLFVDAPANLTVPIDASGYTYTVSGGTGPYTAVSSNTAVVSSTPPAVNGRFVIQGVSAGSASITIKDALGVAITISVTVPASTALFSTAPATLQILSGTTNFYTVFGGTAPYVVNTSGVIAKAVLSGASLAISGVVPGLQTVAISDAKGAVISIDVTVKQGLYTDAPANLSVVNGTGATYSIFGGIPYAGAALYRVNSSNPAIATASISGSTIAISGLSAGSTSLVISDSVGATTLVTVTVPVAGALLSTAPSSLSLATGASGVYALSGGVGPYTATSANPAIVSAVVNGSALTIGAVADSAGGATSVKLTDSVGTSPLTIAVTVTPVQFFTTAPAAIFLTTTGQATYTIFGGVLPYLVQSGNASVVTGALSGRTFTLQAIAGGTAQVLVRDSSGLSVPVSVTVGSANAFFVAAPGATNMGIGTASPAYQISGGTKPYSVSSSDFRVATAAVDPASSTLTINALTVGTTTLRVTDAIGASPYSITVVVDNPSGTASAIPTSIDILASSNTLNSTPNSSISFIVTVKDRLNATLPLQTVAFSASSGTLSGVSPSPVTGAAGTIATVTLAPGADASNRNITVTAATGSVSKSITIPVVGTTLTVSGPGAALVGAGVQSFTVKAVDSSGKPIVGAALSIASALGNGLSPQTVTTDSSGAATVGFTATNVGTDTLTVAGLGTSGTASVVVSDVDFAFTAPAPAALLPVGAVLTPVTVRYRVAGVGVAGQTVTFSSTRGNLSATTAVTDASGDATVNASSTTAGSVTVSAQLGTARTSLTAAFVATVPSVLVLQANPSAVLPNSAGSTTNQSTLAAVVRDATGNPVQNVVVNFSAISDASNGSISPGSATTDASGTATVQFIAGSSSTAANGVQIQAVVQSSPLISGTSTLTVNGAALFISIGRGSGLTSVDASTYQKDFSVYVTDANGAPASNRAVTLSVWPLTYGKGTLSYSVTLALWTYTTGSPTTCTNEDTNKNGTLDLLPLPEDINGDGILQPGIPAVITPSVTTDAQGFGTFTLRYGKNYAWWVTTQITAMSGVSGTESRQIQTYDLELLSTDATSASTPPNVVSPFGTAALCTTAG